MNQEEKLAEANVVVSDLFHIMEKRVHNTIHGTIVGHYAGSEYFFFSKGKELFRSRNGREAVKFLINIYI